MKILYMTDVHLRSISDRSRYRIDDHYKNQFNELYEISDIVRSNKVDLLLCGGDFLHTPRVSHSLITDIISWSKTLSAPFYTVVGNHDSFGYQVNDLKNSGLGVLFEANVINRLDNLEMGNVVIQGVHVYLDPRQGNYYFFESKWQKCKRIIVSHNYISPLKLPFESVLPSEIRTNANIVFSGHYHKPHDVVVPYTRFINTGSISRWSVDEKDRKPTVALLDTETMLVTYIPLQSSKPGNEIFDLDLVNEEREKELNLDKFMNSLEETQFENVDIEDLVRQKGLQEGLSSDILELCSEKIRIAKEELI